MDITPEENRSIKINLDDGVRNNKASDPAKQKSDPVARATATATFATNTNKLESSAMCEPTASKTNSPNKRSTQTAENSTHGTQPGSTKLQRLESRLGDLGAELLNTTHAHADDSCTTRNPTTLSGLEYVQPKLSAPEQVDSIFPSVLPPRPPPKRSFLQRLVDPPTRPAYPAHITEGVSNVYTYRTPDIELGVLGEDKGPHDVFRVRRLKFCGLILIGVILSVAVGVSIYSLVRHAEEDIAK